MLPNAQIEVNAAPTFGEKFASCVDKCTELYALECVCDENEKIRENMFCGGLGIFCFGVILAGLLGAILAAACVSFIPLIIFLCIAAAGSLIGLAGYLIRDPCDSGKLKKELDAASFEQRCYNFANKYAGANETLGSMCKEMGADVAYAVALTVGMRHPYAWLIAKNKRSIEQLENELNALRQKLASVSGKAATASMNSQIQHTTQEMQTLVERNKKIADRAGETFDGAPNVNENYKANEYIFRLISIWAVHPKGHPLHTLADTILRAIGTDPDEFNKIGWSVNHYEDSEGPQNRTANAGEYFRLSGSSGSN
jgi:hypothetical protein